MNACNHGGVSESWWDYVQRVSTRATNKGIAAAAGCDPSTVSHWKNGERPRADVVISLARAYGRSPQEALIAAGYLTEEDLSQKVLVRESLADVSDAELAGEMSRRMIGYSNVIEELRRRAAINDPRKIEPGSSDDVFPAFSDDSAKRRIRCQ